MVCKKNILQNLVIFILMKYLIYGIKIKKNNTINHKIELQFKIIDKDFKIS